MRNTPLWRPQPSSEFAFGLSEATGKRLSGAAIAGLGLAIIAGTGAIGAFALLGDGPVEPAVAAVASPEKKAEPALPDIVTREPLAGRVAARLDMRPAASPSIDSVDVAIAGNELDVARLEEMTGMVAAAPQASVDMAVASSLKHQANTDLRNGPAVLGAETVVVQPEAGPLEDPTETASIRPDETVAPAAEEPVAQPAAAVPALPKLSAAKVNRHVNLRSGPADESRVILVVPAGATVQSQTDCGWCVVIYKGQRGYIYKSFLARGGATASNDGATSVNARKPGLY